MTQSLYMIHNTPQNSAAYSDDSHALMEIADPGWPRIGSSVPSSSAWLHVMGPVTLQSGCRGGNHKEGRKPSYGDGSSTREQTQ